jgi:hypothetical protein
MSELIQLLRALDPNMGFAAVIGGLLIVGLPRVWHWYTTVWFPAKQKLEERRLQAELDRDKNDSATLVVMRDAVMEIKAFMVVLSERLLKKEE